MNEAVYFVMTGAAHLPYLAVAVRSLRMYWGGPIIIFSREESINGARMIARSSDAECRAYNPAYKGKNSQEIDKMAVAISLLGNGYTHVMYLDADVLVKGPAHLLMRSMLDAPDIRMYVTQFSNWTMQKRLAQKRVRSLESINTIPAEFIQSALEPDRYSLNSGVFCASRSAISILQNWMEWTFDARNVFIAGETCLHPIVAKYGQPDIAVISGAYNRSPKFQPEERGTIIWHFHGDCNVRPDKAPKGVELWWPEYQACRMENYGGINDWRNSIGNRYLDQLEKVDA